MFLRREHLAALVVAVCLAASAQPSYAQWPVDGVPLCGAVGDQYVPTIATDGAGGAIVTWLDHRSSSNYMIYAQHVLASGAVDPAWTAANGNANGTPLCTRAVNNLRSPQVVADGTGGAIVTWEDIRPPGGPHIYAQRVSADGLVQWATDGVALCTAVPNQYSPTIATDGAGGAFVAWQDSRNIINYDIYAQHVLSTGVVDSRWLLNGTRLCTAAGGESSPMIVADMAGGAIVTWQDTRNPSNSIYKYNVYAQRVSGAGVVQWATNGVALSTALGSEVGPQIVSDGAGGAIVTWTDTRSVTYYQIYAQHVQTSGAVDPAWTTANGNADGTRLGMAVGNQHYPTLVTDSLGGAIVTWQDGGYQIYVQRVDSAGGAQWTANGVVLRAGSGTGNYPTITTDGANGAIVTWEDSRGLCVYAQHVQASGAVDSRWPTNGTRLRAPDGENQLFPTIVTDMAGGAIVTWEDGATGVFDIYAQRVSGPGTTTAVSLVTLSAQAEAGHVRISWYAPGDEIAQASVYRRTAESDWTLVGHPVPDMNRNIIFEDDTVTPGLRYGYRLVVRDVTAQESAIETWVDVPEGKGAPKVVRLEPSYPNPFGLRTQFTYGLPKAGQVRLVVCDLQGRQVATVVNEVQAAGWRSVFWDGREVASGIYFARLESGDEVSTRKIVIAR